MVLDMTVLNDRKNVFRKLQDIERICLLQSDESFRAFELLMKAWNKLSDTFWYLGYWSDYFRCCQVALNSAKAVNDVAAQGKIFNELGWAYMEWEKHTTAQEYFEQSLQKFQMNENALGQCQSLRDLGLAYYRQRRLDSAMECYRQALDIVVTESPKTSPQVQNKWDIYEAELHNVIGNLYLYQQEFPASYQEFYLALDKYCDMGEQYRYYQAAPLLNLGRWHFLQEDYDQARRYYQDCLQLSTEISRTDTMAGVLLRLAEIAEAEGNEQEALKLANEAERVAGTEITSVRDRAARFKEQLLSKKIIF